MEKIVLFWASIDTQIIEKKRVGIFERDQQESMKTLCDKCFSSLEFSTNLLAWGHLDFLACDKNSKWWSSFCHKFITICSVPRGQL